jgi:hypothetical protein
MLPLVFGLLRSFGILNPKTIIKGLTLGVTFSYLSPVFWYANKRHKKTGAIVIIFLRLNYTLIQN